MLISTVVLLQGITPWNFPVVTAVQKWAPALVLGNTFVHKPSPFTPLSAVRIGELLKDVFPPGVFNVVTGDDQSGFNVGAHLSGHPLVGKVSHAYVSPTLAEGRGQPCGGGCERCHHGEPIPEQMLLRGSWQFTYCALKPAHHPAGALCCLGVSRSPSQAPCPQERRSLPALPTT